MAWLVWGLRNRGQILHFWDWRAGSEAGFGAQKWALKELVWGQKQEPGGSGLSCHQAKNFPVQKPPGKQNGTWTPTSGARGSRADLSLRATRLRASRFVHECDGLGELPRALSNWLWGDGFTAHTSPREPNLSCISLM